MIPVLSGDRQNLRGEQIVLIVSALCRIVAFRYFKGRKQLTRSLKRTVDEETD